jgi:methionyl-tRNA formyltransferase
LHIVFMGSPAIAVPAMEQLINAKYSIDAVYTQPDRPAGRGRSLAASPVKEAALRHGLEIVQPESLKPPQVMEQLASYKPDIIVVCGYGQILTQSVIELPRLKSINVHYSLLPRHRGASPVASALLAGDEYTGVSIQIVRMKLDTGPLLASAAIPIKSYDNTGTLTQKLAIVGAQLLEEALGGWIRGEINPVEQDESKATYFGQVKKEEGKIDWDKPAVEIWNRVRAFQPWPGCFTYWKGKQLKIIEAIPVVLDFKGETGKVLSIDSTSVGVITGKGILKLNMIQYEGKRAMHTHSFIQGQRDFIDSKLPS